jgi:hypothetical protein
MRIVICSAGPSLRQHCTAEYLIRFDLILTVNAAATVLQGDWQVSGDVESWLSCPRRPRHGLCAPRTIRQACLAGDYDHDGVSFQGLKSYEWQDLPIANKPTECNYSIVAAIALAVELGATGELPILGADMGGGLADCSGTDHPGRTPDRWARELADLATIANHARACGASPIRVLPFGVIPC